MAEEVVVNNNRNGGDDESLSGLITTPTSKCGGLFPGFSSESSVSQLMMNVTQNSDPNKNGEEDMSGIGGDYGSNVAVRVGGGGSKSSIAERRAARYGFNAPKINTARFRSMSPLSSPSPYITIPAGLSPASLLDSPVMLSNSQALPSPTTGTYPLPSQSHESSVPISAACKTEVDQDEDVDSSFMFKPDMIPAQFRGFSCVESQVQNVVMGDGNHQLYPPVQPQMGYDSQNEFLKQTIIKNFATNSLSDIDVPNNVMMGSKGPALETQSGGATDGAPQPQEQVIGEDMESKPCQEVGQKGTYSTSGIGKPNEDGYNWRKYGQKHVKGSIHPRSYYKCTHPNCQVKKKVECSQDGQITEIIYKGAHNHPQPQPNRRAGLGSAFSSDELHEISEVEGSYVEVEGGSSWRSPHPYGSRDNIAGSDWRTDGIERSSSASVVTELDDHLSPAQGKHLGILESVSTPELSSTLASHEEEEDRTTQGSISLGDDADDGESESKRRKKENYYIESNMASRAVREPRVVVQTECEVDILDDGFRWRKYGQKVVKGNPNPRSYYKCTSAGCSVRKHVERAAHDLKYVITTYEGKHTHEVPAARNSSHVSSNSANGSAGKASRNTNIPKSEPQYQDLVPRFERKPNLSNEYFKPSHLGGFASDMKFGPSACYDMKIPPFQTAIPCGSFGMNSNVSGVHYPTSLPQVAPEFPISYPINLALSANLEYASFDFNDHGKPVTAVQPFLGVQRSKEEDTNIRFLRTKQEKDDSGFDSMNHLASTPTSVMCQPYIGGFPL
ncbi:hypothetical protein MKX01_028598 [Papaver californicum]|nr:hypothetical protein MKX01_028598 [Papaver californicum]